MKLDSIKVTKDNYIQLKEFFKRKKTIINKILSIEINLDQNNTKSIIIEDNNTDPLI